MTLGERIKKIRQYYDLTQSEFASRIGSVQNTVTGYENGRRNPSAPVIALICREFHVNREWLCDGEGEMLEPKPSDALDRLAYENNFSKADYVIIEKIVALRPEERKRLFGKMIDFMHEVEAALDETEDPFSPAFPGNTPPQPMDHVMDEIRKIPKTPEEFERKYPTYGKTDKSGSDVG